MDGDQLAAADPGFAKGTGVDHGERRSGGRAPNWV